jgi:CIC family chloride channel protein
MFRFLQRHLLRLPERSRQVALTAFCGLLAGLAAVAFQQSINGLTALGIETLARQHFVVFAAATFGLIVVTTLIAGWLLARFCPQAAGSGIPQLKIAYWKDFGVISWSVVWVKFVAGVLTIAGGSSLGREGPSVHLAGGLASNTAGWLGVPKQARRGAAAAGAAAGLAAAFNTPLAAVTFVLEEIIDDLNSRWLGRMLLASMVGALVTFWLIGPDPAFPLPVVPKPSWTAHLMAPVVAAFAALMGALFQWSTLHLRARVVKRSLVPAPMQPVLGGIVAWLLGITIFGATGHLGVFGLGYRDLASGLTGDLGWKLAAILLLAKLVATIACYGTGGCGGIFSPTLFFGCMSGVLVGGLSAKVLPLDQADLTTLAIVGMSASLGAVVRAPVTSIVIVFEMTHEFSLVPALMLGAIASQSISRRLLPAGFYESVLRQDGHELERVIPPRDLDSWQSLPVSAIANFKPIALPAENPEQTREILSQQRFQIFPVMKDDQLAGVVSRKEMEEALIEQRPPFLHAPTFCLPHQTIHDLQTMLVESELHFVVIADKAGGRMIAVITLHDLLRAQMAYAGRGAE